MGIINAPALFRLPFSSQGLTNGKCTTPSLSTAHHENSTTTPTIHFRADNMKDYYEGSVSTIGESEWTEPHPVSAVTAEIAAIEVLKSHAEFHEVAIQQDMDVCVRQVELEGDPIGGWQYFRGKAWIVYRAEAYALSPENAEVRRGAKDARLD